MKAITLESKLPNAGHYVPGMISGQTLYISGQLAAGCGREDVVLCRVYISDIALWDEVNVVYAAFFGSHKPARVVVPTRALHHGALVEIEAVAELKN